MQELEKIWLQDISELGGFVVEKRPEKTNSTRLLEIDTIVKNSINLLQEKSFAFSKADLMIEVYKEGMMMGITLPEFEKSFDAHLQVDLIKAGFRTLNNEVYYTTPKNIARAKYIDSILLQERIENYATLSDKSAIDKINTISSELKANYGWELTKGQKEAVTKMLSTSEKYIAIEGIAGSGKTTMLEQAKNLYQNQGVKVIGMAFTGKAAEAMETEAAIPSQTIHRYLNQLSPSTPHDTWDFSSVKKADTPEVWIVDESSMLTDHLLSNILKASEQRNAKVVFLGDPNQLLPIGTGNAFARMTLEGAEQVPTVRMREINRQEKGSNLKKAVEALSGKFDDIDSNSPLSYIDNSIVEIPQRQYRLNSVIHEYCTYDTSTQDKTTILVALNKDRNDINSAIHKKLVQQNNLNSEQILPSISQRGLEESKPYAIGEKIIFTKNDYRIKDTEGNLVGVKNGQLGKITDIKGHKVTVETNSKQTVTFDTREYKHFDYGYAITTFKAQGTTTDNALIVHDSTQKGSNTRNKIYVDVSRAKKSVKIFTDNREALAKQAKRYHKKITAETFSHHSTSHKERNKNHVKENKTKTL